MRTYWELHGGIDNERYERKSDAEYWRRLDDRLDEHIVRVIRRTKTEADAERARIRNEAVDDAVDIALGHGAIVLASYIRALKTPEGTGE